MFDSNKIHSDLNWLPGGNIPACQNVSSTLFFFYKQPGCLALTRKFCPKVRQLAKQPLRVKSETKFPKNDK